MKIKEIDLCLSPSKLVALAAACCNLANTRMSLAKAEKDGEDVEVWQCMLKASEISFATAFAAMFNHEASIDRETSSHLM